MTFAFIGRIEDNAGRAYASANVALTMKQKSQQGDGAESVESIKYNAPRYYVAQYRAVTAQDYAIITKNIYSNADAVVAYGGDSLNPPVYGKVYIVIKTKTGSNLNDATKNQIAADLRPYAMASIDPVVVDPDDIYINVKVFALYDTGCGSNPSEIETDVSKSIVDWGVQTKSIISILLLEHSNLKRQLRSLIIVLLILLLQTTILKYVKPNTNSTNTYCVATGSNLQ